MCMTLAVCPFKLIVNSLDVAGMQVGLGEKI